MTGVHGRISEQSEERYPRRCVVTGCDQHPENIDFDRGFMVAGLWTQGKLVQLDGQINNIDWAVGVSPQAHWPRRSVPRRGLRTGGDPLWIRAVHRALPRSRRPLPGRLHPQRQHPRLGAEPVEPPTRGEARHPAGRGVDHGIGGRHRRDRLRRSDRPRRPDRVEHDGIDHPAVRRGRRVHLGALAPQRAGADPAGIGDPVPGDPRSRPRRSDPPTERSHVAAVGGAAVRPHRRRHRPGGARRPGGRARARPVAVGGHRGAVHDAPPTRAGQRRRLPRRVRRSPGPRRRSTGADPLRGRHRDRAVGGRSGHLRRRRSHRAPDRPAAHRRLGAPGVRDPGRSTTTSP